jgi:hypothetical protein
MQNGLVHAILGIVLGIAGPLIGTGLFFLAANAIEF